jgi:hypothetical protein
MRAAVALALAASQVGACASTQSPPSSPQPPALRTIALKNPGFEDPNTARPCPVGWDCTMHNDPKSFRFFHDQAAPASGKASLCIEPAGKEPWALASQGVFDIAPLRGARVRFSAAIRVDAVSGDGAGPYVTARGAALAYDKRLVSGTQGWQRIAVEIEVPAGAPFIELGVALDGRGRVCVDDTLLEVIRDPKSPV